MAMRLSGFKVTLFKTPYENHTESDEHQNLVLLKSHFERIISMTEEDTIASPILRLAIREDWTKANICDT